MYMILLAEQAQACYMHITCTHIVVQTPTARFTHLNLQLNVVKIKKHHVLLNPHTHLQLNVLMALLGFTLLCFTQCCQLLCMCVYVCVYVCVCVRACVHMPSFAAWFRLRCTCCVFIVLLYWCLGEDIGMEPRPHRAPATHRLAHSMHCAHSKHLESRTQCTALQLHLSCSLSAAAQLPSRTL